MKLRYMIRSNFPIILGHMTYLNSAVFYSNLPKNKYKLKPYTPREMASSIESKKIFAGPIPYAEIVRLGEKVTPLSNIGVACKNDAKSVFVLSNDTITKLKSKNKIINIAITSHSATSVQLLRILLRDYWFIENYKFVNENSSHDACLVIGDPAIKIYKSNYYNNIYDLALNWKEMTGLPFVFAEWVSTKTSFENLKALSEDIKNSIKLSIENIEKITQNFSAHYFSKEEMIDYINNFTYLLDNDCREGQKEFRKRLATLDTWKSIY
ncbi:MAG: menaquinone biosynthesis protein [Dehalococcoidia bacterium]